MTRQLRAGWRMRLVAATLTGIALLLAGLPLRAQPTYVIKDLGTLGGHNSRALAISDKGHVVGWSEISMAPGNNVYHAFVWHENWGMVDLGTLGGFLSMAVDVNVEGQVVGWSDTANQGGRAFLWDLANGLQDLGTLGATSGATAINDRGQVVGLMGMGNFVDRGFFWDKNTGMVDVGTLGGNSSHAYAISEEGIVTGWAERANGERHPYSWTVFNQMVDLGTFGGTLAQGEKAWSAHIVGHANSPTQTRAFWSFLNGPMIDLGDLGGDVTYAVAVNSDGDIAGSGSLAGNAEYHAFHWLGGVMTDLGTLGGLNSFTTAIARRAALQIVGIADTKAPEQRGFSWTPADGMIELETLGGDRSRAWAVNNDGVIAGDARVPAGHDHAVIWVKN